MLEYGSISGKIVRKKKKLFGGLCMTVSNGVREATVDVGQALYDYYPIGAELTIGYMGRQLVNIRPGVHAEEEPSPETNPWRTPGRPVYTRSSRLRRKEEASLWAQACLNRDEIVSFDTLLYEHLPVDPSALEPLDPDHQYLAVIVKPSPTPNAALNADARFVPAGYDLVEEFTGVSAITNCGGGFGDAIHYDVLNTFGLIGTYREAVKTQKALRKAYPDEPHADCDIVAIWRFVEA